MIRKEPIVTKRVRMIKGRCYEDWRAYCGSISRRKIVFFGQSPELVRNKALVFIKNYESGDGPVNALLNRRQILDATNAFEILSFYGAGSSLSSIAARTAEFSAGGRRDVSLTLAELFKKYLATIEPSRKRSLSSYRCVTAHILRHVSGNTPVALLCEKHFRHLDSSCRNPTTYNSILSRAKAIFRWAVRERLMDASPLESMKLKYRPYHEPCFFLPEKVCKIVNLAFDYCDPTASVPMFFILGFFAGLRSSEIFRARWEDIELDQSSLRVPCPKGITNGGRPRLVELEPSTVSLISKFQTDGKGRPRRGVIVPNPWRITEWKRRVLIPAGLSWGNDSFHNVMRHTYATMHVSAFRNAAATALNLGHGHSSRILEEHYMGLTPRNTGIRYWSMFLPPGIGISATPETRSKTYENIFPCTNVYQSPFENGSLEHPCGIAKHGAQWQGHKPQMPSS